MVEGNLILDRYRPLEVIGEGASGTVEICWDTRIQRRVAIKRLPIADTGASGAVPGLAEARTGAMLSHPAIVSVIDFDATSNEAFLIMEAIEGPTLAQLIDEDPDHMLSLDVVAAVAQAVAEALDFAHENQVLHLDVKPENILVDLAGHVKVSDFGVSELADAQGFAEASGGTIGYMPPEQMLGEDLDQRCDEFAFAAVVYEALTGECPFAAHSLDESLQLIERFDIAAPSSFREDVDYELDEAILTALEPDREARYETVLDFHSAIEPLLGDPKAGALELRELAYIDDEVIEQQAGIQERTASENGRSKKLARRIVMFVLCWLVVGFALAQTGLLSTGASMGVALAAGALAAIVPAAAGIAALGLYGISCIYCAVAPALGQAGQAVNATQAIVGTSWLLSAVFMTWGCTRKRKLSSVFGIFVAALLPAVALVAANVHVTGGDIDMTWAVVSAIASICLVIVGTWTRPQQRGDR